MISKTRFNQNYTDNYTEEQFVENFIYLTNKSRGEHCTEKALRKAYQSGNVATLIKKLDPTLFYSA